MKRCCNCMEEYDEQYNICPHCGYIENDEPQEAYYLKPGTILHGQYMVGMTVGVGGFGIVYKAWDIKLSRVVAIKEFFDMNLISRIPGHKEITVYGQKSEFQKSIRRFLEEAQYLAKFSNHPNIINVYTYFEENNTAYIAMEYLEGITYKEFIKSQGGKIEIESAVSVIISILVALKEIHNNNILHRDVAPDNIYICFDGRIKLMDFGAARFSKANDDAAIILKPGFAPPEQYTSEKQGTYTDIYAVGAVMYLSLTGEMPVESTNRKEKDDLAAPQELNPNIPDKLNNIIMRAMALQSDLRFQSADELIEVLNENYSKEIRSIKEEIKYRKRIRFIKTLAAAGVLLVGILISMMVYDAKRSEINLKPTTINVWLRRANENSTEENFYNALAEFTEKYPQIKVNVTIFSKSEYEGKLAEAAANHAMPDVYETVGEGIYDSKNIAKVLEYLNVAEYSGLDQLGNKKVFSMPITYDMPVTYMSKNATGDKNAEVMAEYKSLYNDGSFVPNEEKIKKFLNGEEEFVVASTSYYWAVQEHQGGKYTMLSTPLIDNQDKVPVNTTVNLAVSETTDKKQYNAAIQMLYYLLGEKAQTKLSIEQHQGLPMQNGVYDRFVQLNSEFSILDQEKQNLDFYKKQ